MHKTMRELPRKRIPIRISYGLKPKPLYEAKVAE